MENNQRKIVIDSNKGLNFNLVKEKILTPETLKKQTSFVYSKLKTRNIYKDLLSSIPRWKGAVIIYGETADKLTPIDCIYSENNLREKFSTGTKSTSDGQKLDRFSWMENLLLSGQFKTLKIFTTTSF